jgi:D-alanyl-D-alanine dipeptidase
MKKHKIFIIQLIFIFILAGCSIDKKTFSNKQNDNSIMSTNQNNEKAAVAQPDATTETVNEPAVSENATKDELKEINGFVLLSSMDKNIVIDLKYATADNFTKKVIYPNNICVLRKDTAKKLVAANNELMKSGYKLKVWDAYRPVYVQQIFWNLVHDSRFVADPKTGGSIHNKGCAVDVTLVDQNNNELTMPSKFDDFSTNAYRTNSKITNEAKKNLELLTKSMSDSGFKTIETEWWHFEDTESDKYNIEDIDLNLFMK